MDYKILVAHPGQQHSYHTASALKRYNLLACYVTTVYDKETSILMRWIKKLISGENRVKAQNRRTPELDDADVVLYGELMGLIEIFLNRYDKSKTIYRWWHKITSDYFGRKVASLAIKMNVDAVIMYDTNSNACFRMLKERAPHILRVMDVAAANRLYMKTIYESDMERAPRFAKKLRAEVEHLWDNGFLNRSREELKLTQLFLSPSTFVKKSLRFSGVEEERIEICPYGTNFSPVQRQYDDPTNRPLRVVYVGNITEMKGISYLLEAAMRIPREKVQFTLVGHYDNSSHIFDQYMEHVCFTGRVLHDKVKDILCSSDVFVFPSLGEGLSLSVLEAMACGLPCIVSENSGANDAIVNGMNGFVIDIQDTNAIYEKIMWFADHREEISRMGKEALESVKKYQWQGSYDTILAKILTQRLSSRST